MGHTRETLSSLGACFALGKPSPARLDATRPSVGGLFDELADGLLVKDAPDEVAEASTLVSVEFDRIGVLEEASESEEIFEVPTLLCPLDERTELFERALEDDSEDAVSVDLRVAFHEFPLSGFHGCCDWYEATNLLISNPAYKIRRLDSYQQLKRGMRN